MARRPGPVLADSEGLRSSGPAHVRATLSNALAPIGEASAPIWPVWPKGLLMSELRSSSRLMSELRSCLSYAHV